MASKVEDVLAAVKLNDLLNKKAEPVIEVKEKKSTLKTVLIIIWLVAVVAAIAYGGYFLYNKIMEDNNYLLDYIKNTSKIVNQSINLYTFALIKNNYSVRIKNNYLLESFVNRIIKSE